MYFYSENVLCFPENYRDYIFPNITILICGYMNLTWEDVNKLSSVFPNIEELRVPYNNITNLTMPNQHNLKQLKVLDLEGNCIKQWSEINKLSVIPSLEHMMLENTKLENIYFESNLVLSDFPNLNKLNINNNLIKEVYILSKFNRFIFNVMRYFKWDSIAELNKLQKLEHLRFMKNPILETENLATREQLVIARIYNLKVCIRNFNQATVC